MLCMASLTQRNRRNLIDSNIRNMRIGILGGTFDPIHKGHLLLARASVDRLKLERLYFVPAFIPPAISEEKSATSPKLRLAMVRAAVQGEKDFLASDIEIRRGGISYTIDTIREFRKEYPLPHAIYFIAGGDWAKSFDEWQGAKEILKLCCLVVATRPGFGSTNLPPGAQPLSFDALDISSSRIREMIKKKEPVNQWLPKGVFELIVQKGLYIR